MTRITILSGAGLLAAQLADELTKHGYTVLPAEVEVIEMAASLKPVELNIRLAPEPTEKTFRGKRIAQWKRERDR